MRLILGGPHSLGERVLLAHVSARFSRAITVGSTKMVDVGPRVCPDHRVTWAMGPCLPRGCVLTFTRLSSSWRGRRCFCAFGRSASLGSWFFLWPSGPCSLSRLRCTRTSPEVRETRATRTLRCRRLAGLRFCRGCGSRLRGIRTVIHIGQARTTSAFCRCGHVTNRQDGKSRKGNPRRHLLFSCLG